MENVSNKTQELPPSAYAGDGDGPETGVYRSAWGLWGVTLTSRVLGLVRDVLMARLLFGWLLDAFVLALTVQNVFRRFMGEGTMAPVLVPRVVQRLRAANRVGANRLIRTVSTRVLVYTGAASALAAAAFAVAGTLLGGETGDKFRFMAWFFPYGPLVAAAGALGAGLNAYGYFSLPALGPVLFNAVLIGALAFYKLGGGAWVIPAAVCAGGLLSLLVLAPAAGREGVLLTPVYRDETGGASEVFASLVPAALSVAVLQVNVLADRVAADVFIPGEGSVGVLYLSHRLIHLPLALFGINLATVFLPRLSRVLAEKGRAEALRRLGGGLRMVVFLAAPAAMGLAVVAKPLSILLFWGGRFAMNDDALERVSYAIVMYSPGILFYSMAVLAARMYHAEKNVKTPAKFAAVAAGANIVLDVVLVVVFEKYFHKGEAGLALASSLSGLLFAAMLFAGLIPGAGMKAAAYGFAASCAAGGALFALMRFRALEMLSDRLRALFGETDPLQIAPYTLDSLSMCAATAAAAVVLALTVGDKLRTPDAPKMWDSALRISLAAWPMAAFAHLVARSIPPARTGLIIPLERALAPVILGAAAYWMLIGFTGVREYDELLYALRKGGGSDE